jgi:S-adenosylmethionine hydrolase
MANIITLLSDFGCADYYGASMKGAILSVNPDATIVDASHVIPPQNLEAGAYVLSGYWYDYPVNTVHCVVIDPGVGSKRRGIAMKLAGRYFVGPDNGLLTHLLLSKEKWSAVELTNSEFWQPKVSNTFHGRDIFAPVAAQLSLGRSLTELGTEIDDPVMLDFEQVKVGKGNVTGSVIHIDHFGNVITNINPVHLQAAGIDRASMVVHLMEETMPKFFLTYAEAKDGPFALISSIGYLELALPSSSLAKVMNVVVGEIVSVDKR